jgi:hypothetical protein
MATGDNLPHSGGEGNPRLFAHVLIGKPVPTFTGHASLRPLAEQYPAHFWVVHVDCGRGFNADGKGAFDGGPCADGFEPAPEIWELREVLTLSLGEPNPADASHVGDRIAPG